MTFAEAAMIMMSGGSADIQPLTVTQNGRYNAPAGVDGFNPVDVNVPDRYDDGYADGEAAVKAKIQSKTITKNGTYYAADDGLDGFDPVNVNVPDRYDEGYKDGYDEGSKDGYDEGYDKGYEDGWEVSAGYYDGSGASTDKPYLLHVYVGTVSIPGYQNTNPVYFDLYEKKDGAWSIVKKSMHYANDNAHYSYDTKINYIKLSPEYGKPSYIGLTGWTKDHSISRTEVFNYSNFFVYGVSSKNCALTSVAPTT